MQIVWLCILEWICSCLFKWTAWFMDLCRGWCAKQRLQNRELNLRSEKVSLYFVLHCLVAWLVSVNPTVTDWGWCLRTRWNSISTSWWHPGANRWAWQESSWEAKNLRSSYSTEKSSQLAFLFSCCWQVIYKYFSWRFSHPCLSTRIVAPAEQSTLVSIQRNWRIWFQATTLEA